MDGEQKRKIGGLIRRIMAAEAREIYLRVGPKSNKPGGKIPEIDIDEIKNQLIKFLADNSLGLSPEAVKRYALRYLKEYEEVATHNPSYGILRQRIERGKYDFSFVSKRTLVD